MLVLCLLLALQDSSAIADRLRSDRIEERDLATRELLKLGGKASPAVEALLSDPDPEVVLRARHVLREFALEGPRKDRLRMEETLAGAKSVHLRFKTIDPRTGRTVPGELWVKGDRIRGRIGGGTGLAILQILSDGHRVRVSRCTIAPEVFEASEGQGRDLVIGVFRQGAQRGLRAKAMKAVLGEGRLDGESQPRPGVLRHLQGVGCGDVLIHDLTLSDAGLPTKQVLSFDIGEVEIETYELTLNEDIPDGMFSLEGK